jgi:hypothetical protein
MRSIAIICAILVAACSKHSPKAATPSDLVDTLRGNYDGWLKELAAAKDPNTGWLSLDDCDGALWMGEAVAAGHPGQLVLAEWAPGEIHRRPKASGECYPKESASTVSNDMLTGYMLGMWATKDLDALTHLEAYGEDHGWRMGQPDTLTETLLSPEGVGLLARAAEQLGGSKKAYDAVPEACLPVQADYEYHIQELAIKLDGAITGSVSSLCLNALKTNAATFPNDALMQAVYGIYTGDESKAIALLTDPNYVAPTYVRPVPEYFTIHRLFAAKTVLERYPN